MIIRNNKEYRNLQEQVLENMNDISNMKQLSTVADLGIKVINAGEPLKSAANLPNASTYTGDYGDGYLVGTKAPFILYVYSRPANSSQKGYWFNWGELNAPSVVPGPQGPVGPQGPQGEQGADGESGTQWYVFTGAPTGTARDGDLALSTSTGNVYQFANNGWIYYGNIKGPQGAEGPQGPRGITGAQGLMGPEGPMGPKGDQGEIGPTGAQGPRGLTGPQGVEGAQGPIGPRGPEGPMGPEGPAGATLNVGTTTTGEPGTEASVTNSGTSSRAVFNFVIPRGDKGEKGDTGEQGPKGDTGATGPQGPQGEKGDTGEQGPKGDANGTITVGTVTTSEPGSKAEVTNSGNTTNAVFNFVIPQGLQGPQGIQGIQGPKGDQGVKGDQGIQGIQGIQGEIGPQGIQGEVGPKGDAATITIGTVTTSEAGGNAEVTNSGDSTNAVLNFTIPTGTQGPKGDQGLRGYGVFASSDSRLTAQDHTELRDLYYVQYATMTALKVGDIVVCTTGNNAGNTFRVKNIKTYDSLPNTKDYDLVYAGRLVGPQGEKGDIGEQGPKGDTGSTGPQGPRGLGIEQIYINMGDADYSITEGVITTLNDNASTYNKINGVDPYYLVVNLKNGDVNGDMYCYLRDGENPLKFYGSVNINNQVYIIPVVIGYNSTTKSTEITIEAGISLTGIQGPEGPAGPEGPQGPKGPEGRQGEQGPRGFAGPEGLPGKDGENGKTPEITVYSTTTGEPGTEASVKNTGTALDVRLAFTIPKGEKGDQGIQGERGEQGPEGPAGPEGPQGPAGKDGETPDISGIIEGGATYEIGDNTTVSVNGSAVTFGNLQVTGVDKAGNVVDSTGEIELPISNNGNVKFSVDSNTLVANVDMPSGGGDSPILYVQYNEGIPTLTPEQVEIITKNEGRVILFIKRTQNSNRYDVLYSNGYNYSASGMKYFASFSGERVINNKIKFVTANILEENVNEEGAILTINTSDLQIPSISTEDNEDGTVNIVITT